MSKVNELFNEELKIINIGLESFYKDLKNQNVQSIHVDWRLQASGNKKMASLLAKLNK